MIPIKSKNILYAVMLFVAVLGVWGAYAQDRAPYDAGRTFSSEELAQMLAPIALYPDPLLSQILMAATYPFEVVEAERWMTKNPYLKKDVLDEALQAKDWDVSVLALCHYPKILTMMSENLSWTARVGDAFTHQEEDVMDAIQELRIRAREAGYLSTSREQRIIVEDRYIRIEPVSPDYIYIPAYDPLVVYGRWWLPMYPPFLILLPGLALTGGVVFSPPFYMEYGVFGWSMFNWGVRKIVIVDMDRTRRFYRHHHERRWHDRQHWRPDADRRHIRERRAGDIPRFVPPVRTKPEMRSPDRRPTPDIKTPERGASADRAVDRDKRPRWNKPEAEKGKGADGAGPRVVDKDRPASGDRRGMDKDNPADKPRMTDRDKGRIPEQGVGKPSVIRDRKTEENTELRKQTPVPGPKSMGEEPSPQKNRDRDGREPSRMESRQDKGDRQERSRDRGEDHQEQKERGGMGRDRGERK